MKKIIALIAALLIAPAIMAGTQNTVPKFSNAAGTKIGNSTITDNGTVVGISTNPVSGSTLTVNGRIESLVGGFKFPDGTTQTTAGGMVVGQAVSGGGANRVLYENGSQLLSASANMTYDGSLFTVGQTSANSMLLGGLGTADTPALRFAGDPNTGIFSQGSDNLNLVAGGQTVWRLQAGVAELPSGQIIQAAGSGSAAFPLFGLTTPGVGIYFSGGLLAFSHSSANSAIIGTSTATFTGVVKSTSGVNIGSSGQTITSHLSATASLDFGATAAGTCDLLTMTVTGAADGNTVSLGIPAALAASDNYQSFTAYVSAANTVTVKRCNLLNTVTALSNPGASTVRVDVWQH
jgi:hypothetical protein